MRELTARHNRRSQPCSATAARTPHAGTTARSMRVTQAGACAQRLSQFWRCEALWPRRCQMLRGTSYLPAQATRNASDVARLRHPLAQGCDRSPVTARIAITTPLQCVGGALQTTCGAFPTPIQHAYNTLMALFRLVLRNFTYLASWERQGATEKAA